MLKSPNLPLTPPKKCFFFILGLKVNGCQRCPVHSPHVNGLNPHDSTKIIRKCVILLQKTKNLLYKWTQKHKRHSFSFPKEDIRMSAGYRNVYSTGRFGCIATGWNLPFVSRKSLSLSSAKE